MNQFDLTEVISFYDQRFQTEGPGLKSVGWSTKESQEIRFANLIRGLDLNEKTILDVGCGQGDLVNFLIKEKINFKSFMGSDISAPMIDYCQKKFNDLTNVSFQCSELVSKKSIPHFDYAFLSGTLSFKLDDNWSYTQNLLSNLFQVAQNGVSSNFLTSYVDFKLEKNFHYEPEKMFSFGKKLSKNVNLFHDYPLYEFTIQILK